MARLPVPGEDSGTWGEILNEYLSQSLKSDGALKENVVTADSIASNAITNDAIAPGTITAAEVADGSLSPTKLTTTGTASGTTFLRGDGTWATPPGGGGGISNIVDDPSPQLGGNLDLNGRTIGVASSSDLTKLSNITANATELNYVSGVTSGIQTQLNTKAASSHTHTSIDIQDSTVIGRSILTAVNTATARTALGATSTGASLLTAADATSARAVIGSGDITGPVSATPDAVALFSGTTGKIIKSSTKTLPTGSVVGTSDVQILSGKTISGSSNTLTNIDAASITDGTIQESKLHTSIQTKLNQAAPVWGTLSGKPSVIAAGSDAVSARAAITAAAASHTHNAQDIISGTMDAERVTGLPALIVRNRDPENIAAGEFEDESLSPWEGNSPSFMWRRSTSQAHSGTASWVYESSWSGSPSVGLKTGAIQAQAGDEFYVEFWARRTNNFDGTTGNSKIRFGGASLEGAVNFAASGSGANLPIGSVWTKITGTVSITDPATRQVNITLVGDGTVGSVWIDDIIIRRIIPEHRLSSATQAKLNQTAPTWNTLSGKPTAFNPVAHTHTTADISDLSASVINETATRKWMTDVERNKLSGIETGADVTDAANVNAAGAVMNSDTSTSTMSFVIDEDTMSSNSSTKVPTQQSTKTYVDNSLSSISKSFNLIEIRNRDPENLAAGDFDSTTLTPWQILNNADDTKWRQSTTRAHTGTASIRIDTSLASGSEHSVLKSRIQAVVGDQFYYEFWAWRSSDFNGTNGDSKLRFGSYTTVGGSGVGSIEGAGGWASIPATTWTKVSGTVTITVAGAQEIEIALRNNATIGTTYIDDIIVRRVITEERLSSSVQTKLNTIASSSPDLFNVRDYGAVGNFSTDDTAAIQAAIDAAEARTLNSSPVANARVVVYFPPGRYLVNGGLTVERNDIHFVGEGLPASRIMRTIISETPVIKVMAQNFTMNHLMVRNDNSPYGSDTAGERSVGIRLENPDGTKWDNSIDASFEGCWLSGFFAAISIFGQGLTVLDCSFTRTYHGVILDFPDNGELVEKDDNLQRYKENAFRAFRFEGIRLQANYDGFIRNNDSNAIYLRSCILSNVTADLGAVIWKGALTNTIITNWTVELETSVVGPRIFDLTDVRDSMIINGRVHGRQQATAAGGGNLTERSMENILVASGTVSNLHLRNLNLHTVREHGFDFAGPVNGLYMSSCHLQDIGYSGTSWRQILFRNNDVQAYLDNITFDIAATTTITPIGGQTGSSSTVIIGSNLRQTDTSHSSTDFIPSITGTIVVNGASFNVPSGGQWKRGEFVYKRNQTGSDPIGWLCTANGSPGTWKAIYNGTP